MIANGDSSARNAFRAALATETPLPLANATQELDPDDVLEVRDMAEAIARAEKIVTAPRSSGRGLIDMFESLGRERPGPATDDAIGPAVPHFSGVPTPIPARFIELPSACLVPPIPAAPTPAIESPVATEDDAYFQPAGRMRNFADVTLDGYRPEPTLLLRAATRRRSFSWILAAALVPLIALAAYALLARSEAPPNATDLSTPQTQPLTSTATLVLTAAVPAPPPLPSATAVQTAQVPVFDVKSLPPVKPGARR